MSKWVPIKYKRLSKTEIKKLAKKYGMALEDFEDCWRYACRLPEDGQKVLVTTRFWNNVTITTFNIDEDGAQYFDEYDDEGDLTAWMPLPEPYKDPNDHSQELIRCTAEKCSADGCRNCNNYTPITSKMCGRCKYRNEFEGRPRIDGSLGCSKWHYLTNELSTCSSFEPEEGGNK